MLEKAINNPPEVSVVIPVFNGTRYLGACLDSAVQQSFPDLEIIIVDDASSDDVTRLVAPYQASDCRVKFYQNHKNIGLAENWNRCIRYASGNWIKFLFQDDRLDPNCVEIMLALSDNKPFVVCERNFIIEKKTDQEQRNFYQSKVSRLSDELPIPTFIRPERFTAYIEEKGIGQNFIGEPPSVLVKRSLLSRYGLFNQNLLHLCDLEFWTRIATNEGIQFLPEKLAYFRVHSQSASTNHHEFHKFRLTYIDRMILLHDYLYLPVYKSLRDELQDRMDLAALLRKTVANTIRYLKKNLNPDERTLFSKLLVSFPAIRQFMPREDPYDMVEKND